MSRRGGKKIIWGGLQLQSQHVSFGKCMLFTILAVFSLVACQSSPEKELSTAKKAFEEAQTEDAGQFAPEPFEKGKEALQAAEAEIAKQEKKFALSRRYVIAKQSLETAVNEFKKAVSEANQGLVFTGTIVDGNAHPVANLSLRWSEIKVDKNVLLEVLTFNSKGMLNNPETMTDSKGRFTLRIHPKLHPEFLETKKQYSIVFTKQVYPVESGLIHLGSMPFLWNIESKDGKTVQIKDVFRKDLGTILIK